MLQLCILAVIIGIWGHLYSHKMVEDEMIFSFMPDWSVYIASLGKYSISWGHYINNKGQLAVHPESSDPNYLQNAILKWGYECGVCHAGFIAALSGIVKLWSNYSFESHFILVVIALAVAYLLEKIEQYYEQH